MTRKNRQKHQQNDRQFAPRSSSQTHPTSCYHGRWHNRSSALVAALRPRGRADLMETGPSPGFGTLLRRYRVAAGLSQEELAERARLSARTIGELERGVSHAPRKDAVELLAQALAVPERATLAEAARWLSTAASARLGPPWPGWPLLSAARRPLPRVGPAGAPPR